jgi:hypothetical protein
MEIVETSGSGSSRIAFPLDRAYAGPDIMGRFGTFGGVPRLPDSALRRLICKGMDSLVPGRAPGRGPGC